MEVNFSPGLFQNVARRDNLNFWHGSKLDYRKVVDFLDFTADDVSRLAGVSKASVRFDGKIPQPVKERLEWTANICNLVFEFFDDDVKTALWFKSPNPMLGNVAPRDMIRLGRYRKLLSFVTQALDEERTREKEEQDEVEEAAPA